MEPFQWDDHFETGLTEIDSQHRHLVDVINRFGELIVRANGAPSHAVEAVFWELAAYAKYHFSEEETLMDQAAVDPRHVQSHKQEHVRFLQEVKNMSAAISAKEGEGAKPLLQFLVSWLAFHILGTDQSMARQVTAIRAGESAANAYLIDERTSGGAVQPLLRALTGLFQQVSKRNRELLELNQTLEARVAERTRELALANERLEKIALTDALTGLPNRRYAMRFLTQAWKESKQEGVPLSCMMVDVDGLKPINDTHGHDAGDEVLRELARALRDQLRGGDVLCRLGGDEFIAICPRTPLDEALSLAERVRTAVSALRVGAGDGGWQGSVSIGVAIRTEAMQGTTELVKAADQAVYAAKRKGRNCVAASS